MRHTLRLALLLGAATFVACDAPPTMPEPAIHPHSLFWFTGYRATSLPFTPTAINDSGVIVGHRDSSSFEVAVAYYGGTLTVLPRRTGLTGGYSAVDITRSGHILGTNGSTILVWPTPASTPLVVTYPDSLAGLAMNDSDMIVGVTRSGRAFRMMSLDTVEILAVPYGYDHPTPLYVSNTGYIAGSVRSIFTHLPYTVRWAPNGVPTVYSGGSSYPDGLHDSGDVLLNTYSGSYATVIWSANGSAQTVTGIPGTPVAAWSSAGRYAGNFGPSQAREPWTLSYGSLTWLTAPNLDQQLVNVVDVNTCGTIIADRAFLSGFPQDSGYVWSRPLTCDLAGTLAGGTSIASPSTAALP